MAAPTINTSKPGGVWRPVYAHRGALHSTADRTVLSAWQSDLDSANLGPVVKAWRLTSSSGQSPTERLQAAAAAILTYLAARTWARTLAALALAAQRAHRAGWTAGNAIAGRSWDDATDYSDDGSPGTALAPADLSDQLAAHTAATVLAAALAATARRLARLLLAEATASALLAALAAGQDISLAADTAVSAAYGAGLLAAYMTRGTQALRWITAGDALVCAACEQAETNSPYSPFAAPTLPMHPNCRCILAPV